MQAQAYDFVLSAGGSQQLAVVGSSLKLLSSFGKVCVKTDTGAVVTIEPGQGIRNFPFGKLTIIDKSGALNRGLILVADADMIDDRVTGEVSVIDGGRARTLAGTAFIASGFRSADSGLHPVVEIWNPSLVKSVTIKSMMISSSVDTPVAMGFVTAASGGKQGFSISKKAPGNSGVAEVWNDEMSGYPYVKSFHTSNIKAGVSFVVALAEPIVLPPGNGLAVASSSMVIGALLTVSAEVLEE